MPTNQEQEPDPLLTEPSTEDLERRKLAAETKLKERELEAFGKPPLTPPAEESLKSKLGFVVLTAVLSGLVSFLTIRTTNRYDEAKWMRETSYSARQTMLNKRIELMDRTVTAVNTFHYMQLVKIDADGELKYEQAVIATELKKGERTKKTSPPNSWKMDKFVADQKELNTFETNWASLLTLDSMYFGDQTRKAVKQFPQNKYAYDDTYDPDGGLAKALLAAMDKEMNKYPEGI
jgi:hypothetical protein